MAASASKVIQGEGRHVLVVGMGLTGYSIVRHLSEQGVGVCVADTRDFPPYLKQIREEFPAIEIITGRIPYDRIGTFDEVVVSPGIELDVTASETPIFPVGDIELFGRQAAAPVIAITGSNGKSTVTMLVTEMLKAAGYSVETGGI